MYPHKRNSPLPNNPFLLEAMNYYPSPNLFSRKLLNGAATSLTPFINIMSSRYLVVVTVSASLDFILTQDC